MARIGCADPRPPSRSRGSGSCQNASMPLPGWESLERTSAYSHFFTYAGWFALFSLVIFEIFAHVYSERRETLRVAEETEARGPRHLSDEKRNELLAMLNAGPKGAIDISCVGMDPEPCRFATELKDVLTDAGWTVNRFNEGAIHAGRRPVGLSLQVQNADRLPARAVALVTALNRVGFPIPPAETGNPIWDADALILTVWMKP